jgi:hypothetical protein
MLASSGQVGSDEKKKEDVSPVELASILQGMKQQLENTMGGRKCSRPLLFIS